MYLFHIARYLAKQVKLIGKDDLEDLEIDATVGTGNDLVGVDSETSDIIRDLIGLDDVMPLLVAIDLPNRRFAIMEYGIEITNESVNEFQQSSSKEMT
ncbi:hypothetical protein NQ314_016221 [Rhamnusium bicolor]|uniref:Uncharacterized protein n=1 Tax=Rhamnusium bicolor TaxID=1586634 RepID=A0AAV8WWY2_9CUCU|nr:hypothetical protein NQ314_016221 [Rhamnusium bicolor]